MNICSKICYNTFRGSMEKIRVAHISDFHLGAKVKEKRELTERIEENLINGLLNIFKVLNLSKVQFLLIAGDFYESSNVDIRLLSQVKEIFSGFNGKIILAPGNHDYFSIDSVYNTIWPENTFIFKESRVSFFEFPDEKVRVYGYAFDRSHINQRLLDIDWNIDESYINLGVFHGQLDSTYNNYAPIFNEDIENSGLDYVALGHIHKTSEIRKLGNSFFAYSGNPVGRGFDETGIKGIILGEISKSSFTLNFSRLDSAQFIIEEIELKDFSSHENIANSIRKVLIDKFGIDYAKNYYRIFINGYLEDYESVNISILKDKLDEINYIEIKDNTKLKIDINELANMESLLGKFASKLFKSSEDNKEELLEIAIKAFENRL